MTSTLSRPRGAFRAAPVPEPAPAPIHPPVLLLRPPYESADGPVVLAASPAALAAPGTILAIRLDRPGTDPHAVEALALELSRRAPACPVVVLLRMPADEALHAAVRLAPLRIRAVVPEAEPLRALLAPRLTDPTGLPASVVVWLRERGLRLNPPTAALLEQMFAAAPAHPTLAHLLDELRVPLSSARFRMRKKRLPSPSRWFQVARALHAAMLLQAHPEASTEAIAHRVGFADHSALAHLLRRSFSAHASAIRETLGWEWLLHRWLSR